MVLEAQGGRWSLPTGGPAWLAYDFCLPDAADGTGVDAADRGAVWV
jgi:hypothetical protein